ncbi:MAG: alpha-(1-_3)-arabinofuranosyltransferase family protein [Acidimicrobiia bacterium]
MSERLRRAGPHLAYAALCYLPLLATAPGQVVADTKSYLYLDPGRLLGRAWSMWDPHVGLGTVTHQNIGFLWPMGPYYWLLEQVGLPDWVAQRLWLGSIMLLAGLGAGFLVRTLGWRGPAVAVATCAYGLSPYLLTISVRISAILLPFVALPWLVALALRATRTGSWRHPAAFALVVASAGTSNATSILLVGVGVALWVVWAPLAGFAPLGEVVRAVGRIGLLTLVINAWWIAGLSVQASHGVPVLRYTESVEVTAAASAAQEVLRGLGYWFFYGDDARGPWVGPSTPYQTDPWLVAATFAVPVLGILGLATTRWRHRTYAVGLLVVGLALAVGVHPYDSPSPFGRVLRAFLHLDVGMAMRSMPRAAPLVVLALAVGVAAGVRALAARRPRAGLPVAVVVVALVVASLPPLWQRGFAPENLRRPEDLPAHWIAAGRILDERDDGTRVLEVPGTDFTSYRWGVTLDPVTPGVTDRPMVARELVPQGSAAGWNLLKALDGRFQANLGEPAALAPVARLLRAGDLIVRSDLAFEHYDTPRPRLFWQQVLAAPGLGDPLVLGAAVPNEAEEPAPMVDELTLATDRGLPDPPPVAIFPVRRTPGIVSTKPVEAPVVVAGDGEGLVDLAAAGLIDGTELVRYSASLTDAELDQALEDGAVLVVTDTNRRRGERWGNVRFTNGYTERAGEAALRLDRSDARLPVFPDAGDDARTVAVHRGGIRADATSYGVRNELLPEHRPASAVDGDPATAWRTAENDPSAGERLVLTLDEPTRPGTVTFLAPTWRINRWVTQVELRFDGRDPMVVDLDERSRSAPGQVVDVGDRRFRELSVEILADSAGPQGRYGGLTSTGFAEVVIGDGSLVLDELVRPPVDLLERVGSRSGHPLALVLTRLRAAPTDVERLDEERALARILTLPAARQLSLTGTARLSARAPSAVVDALLGRDPGLEPVATASSVLPALTARPDAALDGDPSTGWTAAYGDQVGQWLEVRSPQPIALGGIGLQVQVDEQHSVPTRVAVEVDGERVATVDLDVPEGPVTLGEVAESEVELPDGLRGSRVRIVVEEVDAAETTDWGSRAIRTLPVSIAEVEVGGLSLAAPTGAFTTGCRRDLLTLDGRAVAVEVTGPAEGAAQGAALSIRTCDGPLDLGPGEHVLRAAPGIETGVDLDRLVLASGVDGTAVVPDGTLRGLLPRTKGPSPEVTVLEEDLDRVRLRVSGATPGEELWVVLGQSRSDGWRATLDGQDLGTSRLVDGFANGWRVRAERTELEVDLRFVPQRRVDLALWLSLVAALACVGLLVRRPRRPWPAVAPAPERVDVLTSAARPVRLASGDRAILTATAGLVGLALAGPGVAVAVAGVAVVATSRLPWWVAGAVPPLAMAASGAYVVAAIVRRHPRPGLEWVTELPHAHPLAWFAVLSLLTATMVAAWRDRRR